MEHDDASRSREPALPAALPRLDLRATGDRPRVLADVMLSTTALQDGIRTHTCPQCGLNPTTTLAKRTFQYVPPWVYIGLVMNLIVLLILYFAGRRVVKGEVALCADCDAADRRARTLQSVSVGGLVAFPALFGVGLGTLLGVDAGLLGAAVGVVSGIVGMIAAHRLTRFDALRCVMVDKKSNTTTLKVSDSFARVLASEAPGTLR
jgi:hypothetical protein